MESQEEVYIKGFNNGYLLAKHEPELAAKLAAQENGNTDYHDALVLGVKEFEKEMELEKWAKSFSRGGNKKDDKGLSKDKDR